MARTEMPPAGDDADRRALPLVAVEASQFDLQWGHLLGFYLFLWRLWGSFRFFARVRT